MLSEALDLAKETIKEVYMRSKLQYITKRSKLMPNYSILLRETNYRKPTKKYMINTTIYPLMLAPNNLASLQKQTPSSNKYHIKVVIK